MIQIPSLNPIVFAPSGHPLNRGLLGWWLVVPGQGRYGSTVWRDLTGNDDGTLTYDPTIAWKGPTGRPGGRGSYYQSGTAGHWTTLTKTYSALGAYTVSAWFRVPAIVSRMIWCAQDSSFDGFRLRTTATTGYVESSHNGNNLLTAVNYCDNEWHHVVSTYASGVRHIRMDGGREVVTKTAASALDITGTARIGADHSGSARFAGHLDSIRVYDRALSETESTELYLLERNYSNGLLQRVIRGWQYIEPPPPTANANMMLGTWV